MDNKDSQQQLKQTKMLEQRKRRIASKNASADKETRSSIGQKQLLGQKPKKSVAKKQQVITIPTAQSLNQNKPPSGESSQNVTIRKMMRSKETIKSLDVNGSPSQIVGQPMHLLQTPKNAPNVQQFSTKSIAHQLTPFRDPSPLTANARHRNTELIQEADLRNQLQEIQARQSQRTSIPPMTRNASGPSPSSVKRNKTRAQSNKKQKKKQPIQVTQSTSQFNSVDPQSEYFTIQTNEIEADISKKDDYEQIKSMLLTDLKAKMDEELKLVIAKLLYTKRDILKDMRVAQEESQVKQRSTVSSVEQRVKLAEQQMVILKQVSQKTNQDVGEIASHVDKCNQQLQTLLKTQDEIQARLDKAGSTGNVCESDIQSKLMTYLQEEFSRYHQDSEEKLQKIRQEVLAKEKQIEAHLEQSKSDLIQATNSSMKVLDNLIGEYAQNTRQSINQGLKQPLSLNLNHLLGASDRSGETPKLNTVSSYLSGEKAFSNSEYDPSNHQIDSQLQMISGRDRDTNRRIFAPSPTLSQGKPHTERNAFDRSNKNEDDFTKRVPEDTLAVVEVQRLSAKKEKLGETQKMNLRTVELGLSPINEPRDKLNENQYDHKTINIYEQEAEIERSPKRNSDNGEFSHENALIQSPFPFNDKQSNRTLSNKGTSSNNNFKGSVTKNDNTDSDFFNLTNEESQYEQYLKKDDSIQKYKRGPLSPSSCRVSRPSSDRKLQTNPAIKDKQPQLTTQQVRLGNEIIEQVYVDEVIKALDDVLTMSKESLIKAGLLKGVNNLASPTVIGISENAFTNHEHSDRYELSISNEQQMAPELDLDDEVEIEQDAQNQRVTNDLDIDQGGRPHQII